MDIFLSHDWPAHIAKYGDTRALLRAKKFLATEVKPPKNHRPEVGWGVTWQVLVLQITGPLLVRCPVPLGIEVSGLEAARQGQGRRPVPLRIEVSNPEAGAPCPQMWLGAGAS